MDFWISISIIGFASILLGFIFFSKKYFQKNKIPNSTITLGFFIPMLIALFYSETLIELIPQVTLLDLGAFYIIGMISGFFISVFFRQRNITKVDD
jgi:hypothetical protein